MDSRVVSTNCSFQGVFTAGLDITKVAYRRSLATGAYELVANHLFTWILFDAGTPDLKTTFFGIGSVCVGILLIIKLCGK